LQEFKKRTFSLIDGLCYRSKRGLKISKKIPLIQDLDVLPFPKRELIDYKKYKFENRISTSLIASRGCNLECRFCAIREKFRWRNVEDVLEEIKYCFSLGITHFNFEDDNINFHPQFEKILDLIIKNFSPKIKISFMNGLLTYKLNSTLRKKLIKAGITHLDFSLVSSKKELREKLRRKEETKEILSLANSWRNIKFLPPYILL
jgi:radical SAM superfamily enzyme YgiQ (UPF0313 family)